jgi:hypothetical protein
MNDGYCFLILPYADKKAGALAKTKAIRPMPQRRIVKPPSVSMRYRQPMFSDLWQIVAVTEQEQLAIKIQATYY